MNDAEKLAVLLPHWIEHNLEHAEEYRAWIERMCASGNTHVADHLQAAIAEMAAVNHELNGALEHLGIPHDTADHQQVHHHHS